MGVSSVALLGPMTGDGHPRLNMTQNGELLVGDSDEHRSCWHGAPKRISLLHSRPHEHPKVLGCGETEIWKVANMSEWLRHNKLIIPPTARLAAS